MVNIFALVIGGILIAYGLYGVIKRKMFYIFALFSSREKYKFDMARNKPFMQKSNFKDYFIYDSYAIIMGIILIIMGAIIIIVNF